MPGLLIKYLIAFLFISLFYAHTVNSQSNYIWSVVPQFTGSAVHRDWMPLLEILEKKTGYHFTLKLYDTIPDFEKGLLNGEPDFAYTNPYHAVMANEAQGYIPIIRDGKRLLTGILVVRKDSEIDSVQDLKGKKIAFPAPNAFAAALYMRALLREKEGIDFTPMYVVTHSNAYRQTLLKLTTASGGVIRTLRKERKEVQENLQVIYRTPGKPSHPLTVHRRVPDGVKFSVQATILEISQTTEGRIILNRIMLPDPIAADYSKDYLPLKSLNLGKYFVPN